MSFGFNVNDFINSIKTILSDVVVNPLSSRFDKIEEYKNSLKEEFSEKINLELGKILSKIDEITTLKKDSELSELNKKIHSLELEVKSKIDEIENLSNNSKKKYEEITTLNLKNRELQTNLDEKVNMIRDLNIKKDDLSKELESEKNINQEKINDISKLNQLVEEKKKENKDLESQLIDAIIKANDGGTIITKLQEDLRKKESDINTLKKNIEKLEQDKKGINDDSERVFKEKDEEIVSLKKEKSDILKTAEKEKSDISKTTEQDTEKLKNRLNEIQKNLSNKESDFNSAKNIIQNPYRELLKKIINCPTLKNFNQESGLNDDLEGFKNYETLLKLLGKEFYLAKKIQISIEIEKQSNLTPITKEEQELYYELNSYYKKENTVFFDVLYSPKSEKFEKVLMRDSKDPRGDFSKWSEIYFPAIQEKEGTFTFKALVKGIK